MEGDRYRDVGAGTRDARRPEGEPPTPGEVGALAPQPDGWRGPPLHHIQRPGRGGPYPPPLRIRTKPWHSRLGTGRHAAPRGRLHADGQWHAGRLVPARPRYRDLRP